MIETITHYLYNIASFIGGCFAGGVGMHFYYKKYIIINISPKKYQCWW